ncbi:MAG: APC family permease [Alcanivorax sp.]|nr:APC family permease [Alcanivorax sp.]
MPSHHPTLCRQRQKALGVPELVAIALGGMVGGGIFTVLGVSVAMIGVFTPLAIGIGGALAALAAYSYIRLAVYFRDEGGTYSFFKLTFPDSHFAASLIGWWVIFGYISTLALYAFTFASYAISGSPTLDNPLTRKLVAGAVLAVFALINIWSVRGMGKLEDLLVYTKLVILAIIAFVLLNNAQTSLPALLPADHTLPLGNILIIAAVTFVAYEGFELVINAVNEMDRPQRNIPRAIYIAIFLAILIYVVIALGAIVTIPFRDIIANQEYALASASSNILGHWGTELMVAGALLATSSAISGTLFGSSRQMAVIAADGYFPRLLAHRDKGMPLPAIVTLAGAAFVLIAVGSLRVILEFGSITFLLVSLLMAIANFRQRYLTGSSTPVTLLAIAALLLGTLTILYYEAVTQPQQLLFIGGLYLLLTVLAWIQSRRQAWSAQD